MFYKIWQIINDKILKIIDKMCINSINITIVNNFDLMYIITINGMERISTTVKISENLLPSRFVIESKCYGFFDMQYAYDCPGVYRFTSPIKCNAQRVVIDKDDPVSSALLLSCIAYRGNRDDYLSLKQAEKKAMQSLLSMTCGPLSRLIHFLLKQHGLYSRVVNAHTLEELNNYNNGHTLLEVWLPARGRYVVVDVDKKAVFADENGKMMDLFELTFAVYNNYPFSIRRLQTPSNVDWSSFADEITGFNYQFYEAWVYGSENGIDEMIRRDCQIPVFSDNDTMCACAWSHEVENRLHKLGKSWTLLSPDHFLERFYKHEGPAGTQISQINGEEDVF